MSTFAAIYTEVGNLTPSTGVARDKFFVNEAYDDINSRRKWSWLASTTSVPLVAGQRAYTVLGTTPVITDFDSPISVTIEVTASGWRKKIPRTDPQTFEDWFAHASTNSDPLVWTLQGGTAATSSATVVQGGQQQIVIAPPPVATAGHGVNMFLRYWRTTSSITLTADADVPILPSQYHRMITTRAASLAMLFYRLDNTQFERDFEQQLASAMDADMSLYTGDNDTLILQPPIQVPAQSPLTPADRNPSSRPLPAGV